MSSISEQRCKVDLTLVLSTARYEQTKENGKDNMFRIPEQRCKVELTLVLSMARSQSVQSLTMSKAPCRDSSSYNSPTCSQLYIINLDPESALGVLFN